MSDVIEFPTNADQYYRKALSALKVHDFGRAQELLIKSYETDPQVHVFEELIKLYIARGQKADLLNCWQTYFPDIEAVNDWNVLLLYGASLSLLYDLDAALLRLYQLQARFQAAGWDSEDLLPFIHQLNHTQRLARRLEQALDQGQEAIETFINQIYDGQGFELLSFLKYTYDLPLDKALPFFKAILTHPDLPQYIKSDVLHFLLYQNYPGKVTYNWFGQVHDLTVAKLQDYRHQPSYVAGLQVIEDYCEQFNPHLLIEFSQQFVLQALTVYPYFEEAFGSAKEWFQLFLTENDLPTPYDLVPDPEHRQTYQTVAAELYQLIYQEQSY